MAVVTKPTAADGGDTSLGICRMYTVLAHVAFRRVAWLRLVH